MVQDFVRMVIKVALASLVVGATMTHFGVSIETMMKFAGLTPERPSELYQKGVAWALPNMLLGSMVIIPMWCSSPVASTGPQQRVRSGNAQSVAFVAGFPRSAPRRRPRLRQSRSYRTHRVDFRFHARPHLGIDPDRQSHRARSGRKRNRDHKIVQRERESEQEACKNARQSERNVTVSNVRNGVHPRSSAASSRLRSIPDNRDCTITVTKHIVRVV